ATPAHSASLWLARLNVPKPAYQEAPQIHEFTGPAGEALRGIVAAIRLPAADRDLVFAVAGPVSEIRRDVVTFAHQLALTLTILTLGLAGAVLAQVRFGLRPLRTIQTALAKIRSGEAGRLPDALPAEVRPLAEELNNLLARNATLLQRARRQAGDLAHALKNPLTVIRNEAREIESDRGQRLREQVALMSAAIERNLARARAAGAGGVPNARASVERVVDDLCFTLRHLHDDRCLAFQTAGLAELWFAGDVQDLEEMLGNLMDNACKWAHQRVLVRGERAGRRVRIFVEDDGAGIPEVRRAEVLQRGRRLDETTPGTGLGLGIVQDMTELYGGSVTLGRSALGGLQAELDLPAAGLPLARRSH
ncbi:MAG TPA: HAMP domain-containing sensor histidine kinase, partial [Hyphomicrobiaceae bacterium]